MDEYACYLASEIKSGGEIRSFLRKLKLSNVEITDIEARNLQDPKEQRIDGIRTGIMRLKSADILREIVLALREANLQAVANKFCERFNLPHLAGMYRCSMHVVTYPKTLWVAFFISPKYHTAGYPAGKLNPEFTFKNQN